MDLSTYDVNQLETLLSEPSAALPSCLRSVPGDMVVLGAGGKMGPTLAMLLHRAVPDRRVFAVSRFSEPDVMHRLKAAGVTTVQADLLDTKQYPRLPRVENVYYLAGMKFGTSGQQARTWALNTYLPGRMAERYRDARMVVLSTGNVYPFVDVAGGGAQESLSPEPCGEYAQSCLGRERVCQHFSQANQTPMTIVRLNYANEPRYGIIVDLTLRLLQDQPIDLGMAAVNLIWQRDANDYIARAMTLAQAPARILNVTGPETVQVRDLTERVGRLLGKVPVYQGAAGSTCLLSDASACFREFGLPETSLDEMVARIVSWVCAKKPVLNKPTKFEVRNGQF